MNSELPKVLHEVCGRPMLDFVLQACRLAGVDRLVVVIGHGKGLVREQFAGADDVTWVVQEEQKGTGHAVLCARDALAGFAGSVLVIAGDMPLIRRAPLARLLEERERTAVAGMLATTVLDDPTGYGRIVRDAAGALQAIVEDRDCTPQQRAIREVNPSYYCFAGELLFEALDRVRPDNAKGEYYITDVVVELGQLGHTVTALEALPAEDATGINTRADLAQVNRLMQDRIQATLMADGVTIVDPDTTWIEAEVRIGADTVIYPFTYVGTGTRVGTGCRIGPGVQLARGAQVADEARVGPTASEGVVAR